MSAAREAAIVDLLRGGPMAEDKILTAIEEIDEDGRAVDLLFAMVQDGRLSWRNATRKPDLETPLIYSLTAKARRS